MSNKVLLVEDDRDVGMLLKQYLELNGFFVELAGNGIEARNFLREGDFDIILTDIMMPVEDGFSFAENVSKSHPDVPFLFITARKMKEDVLRGLKLGADDYIVKPFDAEELVLRLRNILKRTSSMQRIDDSILIGKYTFKQSELLLIGPSCRRLLTEREAELLSVLHLHAGQLVRKDDILHMLWKEKDFFTGRSMDVFISRLRKYLADDPKIIIESIRGVGLRLIIHD